MTPVLTGLRSRARRLFGREELAEHSVRASRVEHAVLNDVRKRATAISDVFDKPPQLPSGDVLDTKVWERLGEDVWSEYFGRDEPVLREREKIDPRYRVNRELADKNARSDTFKDTHSRTRGQVQESALGLLGAMTSLRESYGDELAEHAERQNEVADAQDSLDSLDDMLEELRETRRAAPGGDRTVEEIDQRIKGLAARKRAMAQQLQEVMKDQAAHAGSLIDATRKAVAKAQDAADEAVECASLLPGKEPGSGERVSPDLAIKFAERVHNSAVLKAVLEMAGRMEISMSSLRATMQKGGYEEMVDIEMGNDLAVVLPHEKMLLMHPVGQLDFFRRYSERSLMQYEMWSEQEQKKGPGIIGADGSGSMRGAPNHFCRGLTIAVCSILNRENRNTAAIEFGSAGQMREFWFPGDQPLDTETALDFAEHFFAGGTDINQVLVRAKEMIDNEAPFHTADLILITDGGDILTDQTIEIRDALRAMGVKIHGLIINRTPTPYMIEVCDAVHPVFEFAGPNQVSDRIAIDLT